jgi:concanavalin A-like lectin/glucanase superfamily protein
MAKHSRIIIPLALSTMLTVVIGYSIFRAHASEVSTTSLLNDANLKAYYRLETNGTDTQGNYNLTLNGSPTFTTGKYGDGMNLGTSNTSTYAEIGNNLGITNGAITISLWVKLNNELQSGSWGLAGKGSVTNYVEYYIDYDYNSGTRQIRFRRVPMYGGAEVVQSYNISLGTTVWHHIVLDYDGSTLYGYVDNNKTAGISASGNGISTAANHFTIGAHNEVGISNYASAIFDDVAVFNRALTDQEVALLQAPDEVTLTAVRTTDKDVSSSDTPQSDDQLKLTLQPKTYIIDGVIFAKSANVAPGIKFDLSATSASSLTIGYIAANDSINTGGILTATGSTATVLATANSAIPIHLSGTVTMSAYGDLMFQWAQNISDGDAITVMKGSYLRAQAAE